jgi:hypothetical protein
MGLGNFENNYVDESDRHERRAYPNHEYDDKLYEWFDELNERFPVELEVAFIEVSTQITSYNAKAYREPDGTRYIRMAEHFVENKDDSVIKDTLLHEMVHIYFYQLGHKDISDSSHLFSWVCGRVGTNINYRYDNRGGWEDCILPFREEK